MENNLTNLYNSATEIAQNYQKKSKSLAAKQNRLAQLLKRNLNSGQQTGLTDLKNTGSLKK